MVPSFVARIKEQPGNPRVCLSKLEATCQVVEWEKDLLSILLTTRLYTLVLDLAMACGRALIKVLLSRRYQASQLLVRIIQLATRLACRPNF